MLNHLHAGDTLIAWRLDRLRRLLSHLIEIVQRLEKDGVAFRSLAEGINTGTTIGRVIFHLFGALAQFERDLIRERAQAGLAAGRARGWKGGQPPKLSAEKIRIARRLLNDPESTVSEVARTLGVHRFTLHKALQERGAEKSDEEVGRGLVHAG